MVQDTKEEKREKRTRRRKEKKKKKKFYLQEWSACKWLDDGPRQGWNMMLMWLLALISCERWCGGWFYSAILNYHFMHTKITSSVSNSFISAASLLIQCESTVLLEKRVPVSQENSKSGAPHVTRVDMGPTGAHASLWYKRCCGMERPEMVGDEDLCFPAS